MRDGYHTIVEQLDMVSLVFILSSPDSIDFVVQPLIVNHLFTQFLGPERLLLPDFFRLAFPIAAFN